MHATCSRSAASPSVHATTVAAGVAPGATWTNTASVTSTTTDPVSGNNAGGVGAGAPVLAYPTADADGDGLPNGFEQQYGLNGLNDSAGNGAMSSALSRITASPEHAA